MCNSRAGGRHTTLSKSRESPDRGHPVRFVRRYRGLELRKIRGRVLVGRLSPHSPSMAKLGQLADKEHA